MASKSNARQPASRAAKPLPEIPDKLYYRIGEVARLCGVETYVLRFWETEFPQLKPNKSGSGQRLYRRREVELARRIRDLLYREGYTIPGARQAIVDGPRDGARNGVGDGARDSSGATRSPSTQDAYGADAVSLPLMRAGLTAGPQGPRLGRLRGELKEILGLLSTAPEAGAARTDKTAAARRGAAKPKDDRPELFD